MKPDLEMLVVRLFAEARPGDLVLTMGAGDMYKVAEALVRKLRSRGPNVLDPGKAAHEDAGGLGSVALGRSPRSAAMNRWRGTRRCAWAARPSFGLSRRMSATSRVCLHYCHVREIPVTVIGRGTNLLVLDGGIHGRGHQPDER